MNIIIWFVMLAVFIYGSVLGLSLWRNRQKAGACAVFIVSISNLIFPFFSILR